MKSSSGFVVMGVLTAGLVYSTAAWGQSAGSTPDEYRRVVEERKDVDAHFDRLRSMGGSRRRDPFEPFNHSPMRRNSIPVPPPRKMTEEHKRLLYPSEAEKLRFGPFLSMPHTGLFRLLPESYCRDDIRIVKVGGSCWDPIPPVPGGGSFYSFSSNRHEQRRLAELWLRDNLIDAGLGGPVLGLIVSLGDVPLENISLQSSGVDYLSNFAPPGTRTEAVAQSRRIKATFEVAGYMYGASVAVQESTTYAMRSITFVNDHGARSRGLKPTDGLVVFRVVGKTPDGSVTLLWRELRRQKSPKLRA